MKICPVCRLELADTYRFCPEDGTALSEDTALAASVSAAANTVPRLPSSAVAPKRAVLLYCPACAAEYPLTFSECPVHAIPLTNRKAAARILPAVLPVVKAESPAQPQAASPDHHAAGACPQSPPSESHDFARDDAAVAIADEERAIKNVLFASANPDENANPRSLRTAARALVVLLVLLGVVGMYTLVKNLTRRPTLSSASSVAQTQVPPQPTITVPTPAAARDYKEEPPPTDNPQASQRDTQREVEEARKVAAPRATNERARPIETKPAIADRQPMAAPPAPPPVTRPLARATDLSLPRAGGQIDARLLNVRANRTAKGYRYDLTFNVQERAGQATQLERLVISTRSMSGINRAQAIPFYHRLGATGTLTFTVSVEMPGRAPSDWQGRVLCTSIGSDTEGKIHHASFGATVTPN